MSGVIYRKYRPNSFSQLRGQDHIKNIVVSSVKDGSFPHAILLSGPRGTGKTTTARLIAKAVNCLQFSDTDDVCNKCDICVHIDSGETMDIIEMDAASNRGIEEIRNLKDNVKYLPTSLKYKIYIIDEAHMLTKEAFNALLKTLEEPPVHAKFILATTEPHKIPLTILSRMVRFDFKLVSEENSTGKLREIATNEGINITEDAIKKVYKISGGSFRDAESLLAKLIDIDEEINHTNINDIFGLASNQLVEDLVVSIEQSDQEKLNAVLADIRDANLDISLFLQNAIDFLLDESLQNTKKLVLANELLEILKNLNKFNDSFSYLKVKLAILVSGTEMENKLVNTSPNKVEKEQDSMENNSLRTKSVEIKKEVVPSKIEREEEVDISDLVEVSPRLKSIVESCEIEFRDNEITFKNKFKFNLNFIEKNQNVLLKLFSKEKGKKYDKIRTEVVTYETRNEGGSSFTPQPQASQQVVVEVEVQNEVDKTFDNSDLVESIL